ncbi:MAG: M67 family metallopeptidase [Fimbriimonadales bacterium]|nr:M67 family metallopeptidase [Fimbriimonadales bacterium]
MKPAQSDFDQTHQAKKRLRVAPEVVASLQEHALREVPREAVGCLLGTGEQGEGHILRACPLVNVHPSPLTHFEVSPESVWWAEKEAEAYGWILLGWYHSHPNGNPRPSEEDLRQVVPFWVLGIIPVLEGRSEVRFYQFCEESHLFEELEWTTG